MVDRLISGAGAWADAADRVVRRLLSGGFFGTRPGSILLAAVLVIAGVVALFVGLESTSNPDPREIAPATVASSGDIGNRTWTTMTGRLLLSYVETYPDDNENGVQDPDEKGERWYYFLVGSGDTRGVVVRSVRPPTDVFRFDVRGTIVREEAYVAEDAQILAATIKDLGIDLDEAAVIDSTQPGSGTPQVLDLGAIPPDGTVVSYSGSGFGYIPICSSDPNGDGLCTLDEADLYDLLLFDPTTKKGIIGLLTESPEFVDATFTGMLRREPRGVTDAKTAEGLDFGSLGIAVSDTYVLDDGAKPASAPLMYALAAILGILAAVIALGWAGGYLVYRKRSERLPDAARTLAIGERLPLRVTGILMTPTGRIRVREVPAALVRFPIAPEPATSAGSGTPATPAAQAAAPPGSIGIGIDAPPPAPAPGTAPTGAFDRAAADPAAAPAAGTTSAASPASAGTATSWPAPEPRSTLIVEREGKPHGIALGMGELSRLSVGRVMPFRGARPAIRAVAGTGRLLLSFESEAERNRAAAELLDETGLIRHGEGIASRL